MQLHFQRDVGQDAATGRLPGQDFHCLGPTSELLVEPFNDIGRPQRNPFFRGKVEEELKIHGVIFSRQFNQFAAQENLPLSFNL